MIILLHSASYYVCVSNNKIENKQTNKQTNTILSEQFQKTIEKS